MVDTSRDQWIKIGLALIGIGIVLGLLGGIAELGELGGSSGMFIFFGLVVLLVGAWRGGGSQQQQQQLVVVQNGGDEGARTERAAVRCPDCGELNPMEAGYCGNCGHPLGKQAAEES